MTMYMSTIKHEKFKDTAKANIRDKGREVSTHSQ